MKNYDVYLKMLTISQEEIEDGFARDNLPMDKLVTPLEYLLSNAYFHPEFAKNVQQAFLFFIHENVTLLYGEKKIIIGDIEKIESLDSMRLITEDNYFEFQNIIRQSVGMKVAQLPDPNEHPKIKAMKAKARYRDYIKAKHGGGLNFISLITSLCCMNIGITPLNVGELAYAAIPPLLMKYQEKEKYTIDIDSLLAGADSKKIKPKYWISNLEE